MTQLTRLFTPALSIALAAALIGAALWSVEGGVNSHPAAIQGAPTR